MINSKITSTSKSGSGFTLLEILISIFILGIITFVVIGVFSDFSKKESLNSETQSVFSMIEDARSRTLSSVNDSKYGVHIEASQTVLFVGDTYSAVDPLNEVHTIGSLVTISPITLTGGGNDVVFEKLTGGTQQDGLIGISLVSNPSKVRTITIQKTGIISSQ